MRSHRVSCHPAEAALQPLPGRCYGRYSIYPPVEDERLRKSEQVNDKVSERALMVYVRVCSFRMLDQQHGTDFHMTFVHQPL